METIRIEFPLKNNQQLTETDAVKAMMNGMTKLIEFGAIKGPLDDILMNYEFINDHGYAVAIIKKDALLDASKLNSIGSSLVYQVDPLNELELKDKGFSTTTIQERLRISALDPKIKFRLTVQDYKKYWAANKSKIKDKPLTARRLKNMFITDLMSIFTEVLPAIQEGRQLEQLIGMKVVMEGLTKVSKDLSLAYKRALQQTKAGNGLQKNILANLQKYYNEFINQLIPQVFPGIEDILKNIPAEGENKSFSDTTGIVTVVTDMPEEIHEILSKIKKLSLGGRNYIVTVTCGDESKSWDLAGDGTKTISSIEMKASSSKEYISTSDGRLSLFK